MNEAVKGFDLNTHYKAVFFILPFSEDRFSLVRNNIRRENIREFYELHSSLYAIYCRHQNFIVVPGNLTPKEPADFILYAVKPSPLGLGYRAIVFNFITS